MSGDYYSILTNVGKAKIAKACKDKVPLILDKMAVGDGGGESYNPSEDMTKLKNETYRCTLNTLIQDPNNETYLIAEILMKSDIGGFSVREAGLFDQDGDMIAIAKVPETYKPGKDEGAGKELYVKFIMEVSNTEAVTFIVDPSVVMPTMEMVDTAISDAITIHVGEDDPHEQYVMKEDSNTLGELKILAVDRGDFFEDKCGCWLKCAGGKFSKSDFMELSVLLGDTYGKSDENSFVVPDFTSRAAIGAGTEFPFGKYIDDTMQPITGRLWWLWSQEMDLPPSGAFYKDNLKALDLQVSSYEKGGALFGFNIDSSRVTRTSDHTQTRGVAIFYYIYGGTHGIH